VVEFRVLELYTVLKAWCSIEHQGLSSKVSIVEVLRQGVEAFEASWYSFSLYEVIDKEEGYTSGCKFTKGYTVRMKALLEQQGLAEAMEELPAATIVAYDSLVGDLAALITVISDEDHALLLLTSLPSSYDNFVETLLYGRDTLKLEDVLATLNSRELQKMTEAKDDGGKGLYNHKKSQSFVKNLVFGFGADEYDSADVMMAMSVEELLD
ncbi:hypothetical protein Tco_1235641, partial [Tanacetum coccineum]